MCKFNSDFTLNGMKPIYSVTYKDEDGYRNKFVLSNKTTISKLYIVFKLHTQDRRIENCEIISRAELFIGGSLIDRIIFDTTNKDNMQYMNKTISSSKLDWLSKDELIICLDFSYMPFNIQDFYEGYIMLYQKNTHSITSTIMYSDLASPIQFFKNMWSSLNTKTKQQVTTYQPSNIIHETYSVDLHGKIHGHYRSYDSFGMIKMWCIYKHDILHGACWYYNIWLLNNDGTYTHVPCYEVYYENGVHNNVGHCLNMCDSKGTRSSLPDSNSKYERGLMFVRLNEDL